MEPDLTAEPPMSLNDVVADLCLNKPLYFSVPDLKKGGQRRLQKFLADETIQLDCYCIYCKRITPFRALSPHHSNTKSITSIAAPRGRSNRYFGTSMLHLSLHCQRELTHSYSYIFSYAKECVRKVGQFPSYEDIASSDLNSYRHILERIDFNELRKAGGLYSHGISIGAFVYLRRIFERMIQRHYQTHEEQNGPISDWNAMRMDQRIGALADLLPATLVDNRNIYSILSAGVHDLQEADCHRYFPVIRAGIIAILEEDTQRRARDKAAAELRKAVDEIVGEIRAPTGSQSTP